MFPYSKHLGAACRANTLGCQPIAIHDYALRARLAFFAFAFQRLAYWKAGITGLAFSCFAPHSL